MPCRPTFRPLNKEIGLFLFHGLNPRVSRHRHEFYSQSAQARCPARFGLSPRRLYPSSICLACLICFGVYLDLSPLGIIVAPA